MAGTTEAGSAHKAGTVLKRAARVLAGLRDI